MWKAEKARRELLVKSARLDMAALLVLSVVCFLPLHGELDCTGTHAWESLLLAYFGLPVWCVAFLYRPRSLVKWGWDVVVFGGMLVAELLLIGWHAPLLWGGRWGGYWYLGMLPPGYAGQGVVWGWLPVHACLLMLAGVGLRAACRTSGKCL